ncbi:Nif3-like dinuclear metal center hexameric protein [Kineococcus auxinigenes]|uniref:Nif3-like dinuclear metal center hexameric protein n=1 Tax=unclassified Kineococcus TaxID=2621656 RepID=UPI003D7C9CAD
MPEPTPAPHSAPTPGTAPEPPPAAPALGEVLEVLQELHPERWAQPWDAVGLVCGDPTRTVRRVLLAVDPVEAVVDEALDADADLLLVHHPLLLRPVSSVAATTAKGRVVHRLVEAGCALYVAHTNADAAAPGVSDALARVLDLDGLVPLEPLAAEPGRPELGIGRVGTLPAPERLADFADRVAQALPATEQGVRVAGDLDALVQRVAVCGGSGDSLFAQVRASGADVYVTADLRHHPASEARESAGFGAGSGAAGTPHLVDVAHWASEWPWLAGCADRLVTALAARGRTVDAHVSTTRTDPWALRVPSRGE